jgi:phosphatidylinositol glycan class B
MQSDFGLFLGLYFYRLLISFLTVTNSHPDEYWQSHEPAYKFVYGIGSPTYEWLIGMRSHVFLLPYICGLALGRLIRSFELHLGPFAFLARAMDDWLVLNWRLLVAAFIAATIDLYTVKLARRLFSSGKAIERWALLVSLTNATLLHTLCRTYSNCTETMLSLVALHYWPMKASDWSQR